MSTFSEPPSSEAPLDEPRPSTKREMTAAGDAVAAKENHSPLAQQPKDEHHHHHDHHHGSHGHDEHGAGGGNFFYRSPRQRQRWTDEQHAPHTEWGDIFFDLFYVAAAYKLGSLLREDPSSRGLLYVVGCFFPIMGLWHAKMRYGARFYVPVDLCHRLFEVATLVPLGSAVLFIRTVPILSDPENHVDMFAYSLSIVVGMAFLILRSLEVMLCSNVFETPGLYSEAYYSAKRDVIWMTPSILLGLSAAIYAGIKYHHGQGEDHNSSSSDSYNSTAKSYDSYNTTTTATTTDEHHRWLAAAASSSSYAGTSPDAPVEDDVAIWLCLAAPMSYLAIIFLFTMVLFDAMDDYKKYTVPMNIDYCIHRFGEWIMLLLGESVLSLLIVTLSHGADYYITFFSGVVTVILLEFVHYRSQPHDPDSHALRGSKYSGMVFSTTMWVYSAALIILGTCYKMFLYEFVYADVAPPDGGHRTLSPLRFLAGLTTALRYDTEDRQQRIAHFFSGSMALVWLCLDVTILAHHGFRFNPDETDVAKLAAPILIALRVGLIVFIATLSQYVTDPMTLALTGMSGVFLQLVLRVAFTTFASTPDEEEEEEKVMERMAKHLNARIRSRSSLFSHSHYW